MYKKLSYCKYCQLNFDELSASQRANHSRWCSKNPKRSDYVKTNNGAQFRSAEVVKKRNAGIKRAHAEGKYSNAPAKAISTKIKNDSLKHTPETKDLLRQKALASPHRRLVRSIRDYIKKDGTTVKLDSAWEEALAIRLDNINVSWIRPTAITWVDKQGVAHNYFPDFYLPDYNLYLDPKNPYAVKAQLHKIQCLREQIANLKIIETLDECKNFTPKPFNFKGTYE